MIRIVLAFFILLLSSQSALASIFEHQYVESPYMRVQAEQQQLYLYKTEVNAEIVGIIADVSITQYYKNEGDTAIEAVYVFPASPSAAVYGLTLNVNGRITKAVIQEKAQARQTYEAAKSEGKSASLLVQEGPNVFTMNVANILPGDSIQVELNYVEQLVTQSGNYRFQLPVSIGPQYGDASTTAIPKDFENSIIVDIYSALPVSDVSTKHHDSTIKNSFYSTTVSSSFTDSKQPFILDYSLRSESFNSGLQVYDDGEEKYFMLMTQPPKQPRVENTFPREYIFIVDVSGSMDGMPTETCKKMMAELLYELKPQDRFNIYQFAGGTASLADQSLPVNENTLDQAFAFIEQAEGYGGTEILPALDKALSSPKPDGFNRSVVVMTDGLVNVEKEAFDLVRSNLGQANLFSFGVFDQKGYGSNEYLIEGLARIGQTDPILISSDKDIESMISLFVDYISQPLLSNIQVDFGNMEVYDLINDTYPDIFTQRPLVVLGKWKGDLSKPVEISGNTYNGGYSKTITVDGTPNENNKAIKYLWARERLKTLSDYDEVTGTTDELREAIIALGLKYNLLTAYTSFVAVDEVIRNPSGELEKAAENLPPQEPSIGLGFDESEVELPISRVEPETKIIHSREMILNGETWVELGIKKSNIQNVLEFNSKSLVCLKDTHPHLVDILMELEDVILNINGKAIQFKLKEKPINTCEELYELF
ncbi:VIT domain-containing protein [Kangiella sp.]|uniref:VIT domain-containing protein n=1 Tax=Kangiella sp. TaxID=1920245 RepID=UPI003A8F2B67